MPTKSGVVGGSDGQSTISGTPGFVKLYRVGGNERTETTLVRDGEQPPPGWTTISPALQRQIAADPSIMPGAAEMMAQGIDPWNKLSARDGAFMPTANGSTTQDLKTAWQADPIAVGDKYKSFLDGKIGDINTWGTPQLGDPALAKGAAVGNAGIGATYLDRSKLGESTADQNAQHNALMSQAYGQLPDAVSQQIYKGAETAEYAQRALATGAPATAAAQRGLAWGSADLTQQAAATRAGLTTQMQLDAQGRLAELAGQMRGVDQTEQATDASLLEAQLKANQDFYNKSAAQTYGYGVDASLANQAARTDFLKSQQTLGQDANALKYNTTVDLMGRSSAVNTAEAGAADAYRGSQIARGVDMAATRAGQQITKLGNQAKDNQALAGAFGAMAQTAGSALYSQYQQGQQATESARNAAVQKDATTPGTLAAFDAAQAKKDAKHFWE